MFKVTLICLKGYNILILPILAFKPGLKMRIKVKIEVKPRPLGLEYDNLTDIFQLLSGVLDN